MLNGADVFRHTACGKNTEGKEPYVLFNPGGR
jgi:hypothetical protein